MVTQVMPQFLSAAIGSMTNGGKLRLIKGGYLIKWPFLIDSCTIGDFMKRDLSELSTRQFDLVVVGGGVLGASVARDAALRGLSVALVEQADFCSATSHNSLKTIHGGIRYLQHLNFKRAAESIREQQIFLQTAPHLVQPMRFLMPAYGFGMRGPAALGIGVALYELLNACVALIDGRRLKAPKGRVLGAKRYREMVPGMEDQPLSGGAMWMDAQVSLADKAVLQMLQQAAEHGASVANYVTADAPLFREDDPQVIAGVKARDMRSGACFDIQGHAVVNATGPWAASWINGADEAQLSMQLGLVKSMNLVTRKPALPHGVAVRSNRASDSKVDSANRMFFVVPWQGKTMIGTTHVAHEGAEVDDRVGPGDVADFVEEFNEVYPELGLTPEDVLYSYAGLAPAMQEEGAEAVPLHESEIIDHGIVDGIVGLFSIVSVKWTTARLVAEQTVDQLLGAEAKARPCQTRSVDLPDYENMPHEIAGLTEAQLRAFVRQHVDGTQAWRLSDVLLRRTNDLVLGAMSAQQFEVVVSEMAALLGWSEETRSAEISLVLERLSNAAQKADLSAQIELIS